MKIEWNTDVNAPCAGEICGPKFCERDKRGRFVWRRRSILVQTDWDYPATAETFGWSRCELQQPDRAEPCDHSGTDGTVTCRDCGLTATDFISAAYAWLEDHDGAVAEDPGYF